MRKTTFVRLRSRRILLFCLALFTFVFPVCLAQTPVPDTQTPQPAALPSDAKALLLLAEKTNSLTEPGTPPWHLKATFKILDQDGNPTDQGTYEELWVSPTKFKRTFTSSAYTQTDYGTDKGVFRSGPRGEAPGFLLNARREFAAALPGQQFIEHESFNMKKTDSKGAKLSCIHMSIPDPNPTPTYCLESDRPVLRVSVYSTESLQIVHNRILKFQGHFVPGELSFVVAGKPVFAAHVESIEVATPEDDAAFIPSPDAVLLPRRVNISGGVAAGLLKSNPPPLYPKIAMTAGASGTVVLKAVIDVNGTVKDLEAISGPPLLQQAAINAVQTWKYRPYLLNGSPIEVQTTINVVFALNK